MDLPTPAEIQARQTAHRTSTAQEGVRLLKAALEEVGPTRDITRGIPVLGFQNPSPLLLEEINGLIRESGWVLSENSVGVVAHPRRDLLLPFWYCLKVVPWGAITGTLILRHLLVDVLPGIMQ